ncbi:hypothetical protein EDD70_2999 [Hydrogenoanaerobacterium saccharovorans]|uniref:Single-strand binding protein family protein n=1 Tax=Hydrogenoanaerobacterium saccharovorans TaxID=474960 RepID=A0A1H8EJB6_9FIRM|nr:hypothetical protein [Hydrogenoanaerobacterium saccharovorans]RPF41873.1 hypothetical protein EDD70_2999 [Hydrogenoanaerobacterium saccharovorans]SEN19579.1 hypothetical protein SAMN05216180_3038 [Hydrogenoanaerobacterium saccharovorans]
MKSFAIGKVIEPEVKRTQKGKNFVEFGLLVGKSSIVFSVWDDDNNYKKCTELTDGDNVCVIINPSVTDKGNLRFYVSNIVLAPEGLRETMLDLFVVKK